MKFVRQPWQVLLAILAGWVTKHQQDVVDCLLAEDPHITGKARQAANFAE